MVSNLKFEQTKLKEHEALRISIKRYSHVSQMS